MDWNTGNLIHAFIKIRILVFNECHLFCRWVQTGSLQADSHISSLSWNLEGTRLLTGGVTIQMWHERITNKEEDPARKFTFRRTYTRSRAITHALLLFLL